MIPKVPVRRPILQSLHSILCDVNVLVRQFKSAVQIRVPSFVWSSTDNIMGMDVAALVAQPGTQRDIVMVHGGSGMLHHINDGHQLYHPLAYPLLFPFGTPGWHTNMQCYSVAGENRGRRISLCEYMRYYLMHRASPTHWQKMGRLSLEFYCDAWGQLEARLAHFHSLPVQQALYRSARVSQFDDFEANVNELGRPIVRLPASFVGSPKYYHMLYMDAMALPRRFGKPDLFITMTCNPKWAEITAAIPPHSSWESHPDIVARVFVLKFKAMMSDILKKQIFGEVVAYVWRCEWQARGLPHIHLLVILKDKIMSARHVDAVVSAEVPDPVAYPLLHMLVGRHMIHTPCDLNVSAGCREESGECKRHFPKQMQRHTTCAADSLPTYRRQGLYHIIKGDRTIGDQWVVPYNPYLLMTYQCHCNVECASHIRCFKYIYKYVFKKPDSATISIHHNDAETFLSGRLLSCSEAVYRFLSLPLHHEFPAVMRLHIHLPRQQTFIYDPTRDPEDLRDEADRTQSTLLQWFELNRRDINARKFLYHEIPEHYSWKNELQMWMPRQKLSVMSVGRIFAVSIHNLELWSLRKMLAVVTGALNWEDLATDLQGEVHPTFRSACVARGMESSDNDIIAAFREIADVEVSMVSLHRHFALMLMNTASDNAVALFDIFASDLCGANYTPQQYRLGLLGVEAVMREFGQSLEHLDYGFQLPVFENDEYDVPAQDIASAVAARDSFLSLFTAEQHDAMQAILTATQGQHIFYVKASAGCGKSLFVNGLASKIRAENRHVMCVAASALAAAVLLGGRTAHAALHIPVPAYNDSMCCFTAAETAAIRACEIIFWDEVSMVLDDVANCVDASLRHVMDNYDQPFGGKTMVFLGDFQQLLPVIRGGQGHMRTVKRCSWWPSVRILTFTKNWRAHIDPGYAATMEQLGSGHLNELEIPATHLVPDVAVMTDRVYGQDICSAHNDAKLILAFTLDKCVEVNNYVMGLILGVSYRAASADSMHGQGVDGFPLEYIQSIHCHGAPPAILDLKIGARYLICRNYDPRYNICNGIMCLLLKVSRDIVEVKLITGPQKGFITMLPRCVFQINPDASGLPFTIVRRQFPLMLSYCLSVHKAQGQSLTFVGIIADTDPFAHGQTYVAFSRVGSWGQVVVLTRANECSVTNVVYRAVLAE